VLCKSNIIRLSSISRHVIDNGSCIVLDSQQDARSHVHTLALVPAHKKNHPGGREEILYPDKDMQLLRCVKAGEFPICFRMQTQHDYLVLGLVSKDVIPGITSGANSTTNHSPMPERTIADEQADKIMVRTWIESHKDWLAINGIVIHA